MIEKTGPDTTLSTLSNSVGVIEDESLYSVLLDFDKAENLKSKGLETEFNSGIVPTKEVCGRIHLAMEIGSVTLDALYDP